MTDATYWVRVLGRLWVHGSSVRLTYVSRDGSTKTWTGKLQTLGKDGPYITWQGKPALLCPWGKLISVEDAKQATA